MMFIELASYVGDVLSYYIDHQFKEGFLQYSSERKNIISLANYLGYKIRTSVSATTELEVSTCSIKGGFKWKNGTRLKICT